MPGLEDLLSTPISSATPEQIESMRQVAGAMMRGRQHQGPYTWGNAFGDIAEKLSGAYLWKHAGELQKGGLSEGAKSIPTFDTSEPGQSAPPASSSSQTADQTSSTPGGGGAAAGQPATNAADISTRLETGHSDPMKGLANISPDTNGSKSYGNFGLNSQPGYSAHDFKRDYGEPLGLTATPGTPEFDAQWLKSVRDNPVAHRAAEVDWYNKNVVSGVSSKLEKVGVSKEIASDPRVGAYFSDRVVQQGPGSITGDRHAARIQAAYSSSGEDPVKFLKAMSAADRTPEALQADFPRALKSGVYSQRGNDNRVMGREALALGLPMPTAGAAPPPTPQQAIAPMINALAGPGGAGPTTAMPGVSLATPEGGAAQPVAPSSTTLGTLKNMGVPGPGVPQAGALAPQQQAMVSAIGGGQGGGAAPGPGPAAMTQAIAGPAKGKGPDIPPTQGLPPLPKTEQIQALLSSNIPQYVKMGQEMQELRMKALQPQQITNPMTGDIYVGNPYVGYNKLGVPGMPQIEKDQIEVAGSKFVQPYTFQKDASGNLVRVPVRSAPPMGAPAPSPEGGAAAGAVPPPPDTSDIGGMTNWGIQVGAAKKTAEATAEEQAKGAMKPMTEAMDRMTNAQTMIQNLDIMANAYRQGNMSGGPLGPYLQDARGVAAELGLINPNDKTLTAGNIVEKIGTQLAFRATKELTSRPAAQEVVMQVHANPGLRMNDKSAMYMIDIMRQQAVQDREIGKLAYQEGMTPQKFVQARDKFYAENPLISPFTGKPITEKGGGVPGTKSGPPLNEAVLKTPGTAAPTAPGTAAPAAAPTPVNSPEEAMKLPPGTSIRLPDGTIGKVPGG